MFTVGLISFGKGINLPSTLNNGLNSLAWVLLKTFLFQAIQFSQTDLIQPIQFSISIDFLYSQLNVKTVLY